MSENSDIVVTQQHAARRPPPIALGINVEKPEFPQYADYAKRMESFDAWPEYLPVQKDDLVEAGLVYTGVGDSVRCYFCGGGLRNWEQDDVPMEEHAKWYPWCPHVLLVKGHAYVEKVSRGERPEEDCSFIQTDHLESVAAQACLAAGVSKEMVKKAIDTFIERYGNVYFKARDLVEIVYDLEEEAERVSDNQTYIEREDERIRERIYKLTATDAWGQDPLPHSAPVNYVGRHTKFQKLEWIGKGKNKRSSGVSDWATSLIKKLMNIVDDTLKTATDIMSLLVKRCPQLFPDLTREPTEKDLVTFAEAIGDNFRFLGLALGLSDAKLDQISLDNPTTVLKSYKMLREWVGKTPLQSTVSSLIQTMKSCRSVKIDWDQIGKVCMRS